MRLFTKPSNLILETLAQTWFAWFIATAFAYKYYYTISIIHVSRTRAGWKLDSIGISFLNICRGGPPWSDFCEISFFRCKVPQTHAVDQSTIKSGLGQGIYDARPPRLRELARDGGQARPEGALSSAHFEL